MKNLLLFFILSFAQQSHPVDGNWIPVHEEIGGQALPARAFEKQKLVLKDSTYTMLAESIDKGIAQYHGEKIDIYGKEGVNAGRHLTAIWRYENGQLTLCYNLKGDGYPDGFATKGKPMYFMAVFRRANN